MNFRISDTSLRRKAKGVLILALSIGWLPAKQQGSITIVSSATSMPIIAPNSLATVFGQNLAQSSVSTKLNGTGELPKSVNGTSVSIGGRPATLIYVSPSQINFLVPADTPLGNSGISVSSPMFSTPLTGSTTVALIAPGLFTVPCLRADRGAILNGVTFAPEPFRAVTPDSPGDDKRTRLSIFGTGLRYAGNSARDGGVVNVAPAVSAKAVDQFGTAWPLAVEYAGAAPGFSGLDQINVLVPPELEGAGLVHIQVRSGDDASNSVSTVLSKSLDVSGAMAGTYNIQTVAGTGSVGFTGSGSALQALLKSPTGVALDRQHNLFIASAANHVVQRVATDGTVQTVAGTGVAGSAGDGGPARDAQLKSPVSLAVDHAGNLYIADSDDNKIRRVAPDGTIGTYAGTSARGFLGDNSAAAGAQLSLPSSIAIDRYGAILVADTGNNRVRKVTPDGVITTVAGTGNAGSSGDGGPAYLAELNAPESVAVGADGTLYIADSGNHRLRLVQPNGTIRTIVGDTPDALAPQTSVSGSIRLAIDGDQRLLISDSQNARIQVMNSQCQLNALAGTGVAGFAGDGGSAKSAEINNPANIAVDRLGDIFLADTNNNRIRKVYLGADCSAPASISFDPQPAQAGTLVDGLVRVPCPASANTSLALGSDDSALFLPSTLAVPAGQTDGSFSFSAPDTAAPAVIRITALNPQHSGTGTLVVSPRNAINSKQMSLTLLPASQVGGGPVSGVVSLATPAPASGTPFALESDNPAATVVPSITIPAGQMATEFAVVTVPVDKASVANITASSAGTKATTPLSLQTGSLANISSLQVFPSSIAGGDIATGTVTLDSPASATGAQVALTGGGPVTIPPAVTVPAGQQSATFPISTTPVSKSAIATITAASANNVSASLTVNPKVEQGAKVSIGSVSVSPSSVPGGQNAIGTVQLRDAAPVGGASISLQSTSPDARVPATLSIPAGSASSTFTIQTLPVTEPDTATVTATSANSASATLSVNPASSGQMGEIATLSISPPSVTSGQSATGTVTLGAPAPANGVPVNLSSDSAAAMVPSSVTIPSGQSTATFAVSTSPVSSSTNASITATSAVNSMSATLTINPSNPCTGSVTFGVSRVIGGNPVNGNVALTSAAGPNGQPVSLSSTSPKAQVPATVTVPPGQNSASFTVTTSPVLALEAPLISASTAGCASSSAGLTLLPQ